MKAVECVIAVWAKAWGTQQTLGVSLVDLQFVFSH